MDLIPKMGFEPDYYVVNFITVSKNINLSCTFFFRNDRVKKK